MKVLVAMSGGVDSSVAAAELVDAGHQVTGVTLRLWGGASDTGCCSVADVDDARRVAQQLGIDHVVFNFSEDFDRHVVQPYVDAHRAGTTPNPCIECNRRLKFDRLLQRADALGFDAVATGHHARVIELADPASTTPRLAVARGADAAKDQSYVVHMLTQQQLRRTLFPVGHLTKAAVRERAARRGLRTATKPDSQDVCFITDHGGREQFLGERIPFTPARVVDADGAVLGGVPAVELVTIGQRRGLGIAGGGPKRFVTEIRRADATVVLGPSEALLVAEQPVGDVVWADLAQVGQRVLVQCSAHGTPQPAVLVPAAPSTAAPPAGSAGGWPAAPDVRTDTVVVRWDAPQRVVAAGQSVVFYDGSDGYVLGGGTAR